jgi:peptide/nickel transport system permease protein
LVVTGFNALGDGIRDAIDAETDLSDEEETSAAASGAGG